MTNSYRHGFPSGQPGSIILHFDVKKDYATLSVTDDGIGFDTDDGKAMMGQQLMDAFAQQLDGKLTVESVPGESTIVKLRYPLPKTATQTLSPSDG